VEVLKEQILLAAELFMVPIDILANMKGMSVFIAIIADVIEVSPIQGLQTFYVLSAVSTPGSKLEYDSKEQGDE
jgi:hypothetical protein